MVKQVRSATGCRLLAERHGAARCGEHGGGAGMGDNEVEPSAGRSTDLALAGPEDEATVSEAPRNGHRDVEHDLEHDPEHDLEPADAVEHPDEPEDEAPAPVSGGTEVVQDAPAPTPAQLRRDFGA